MLADTGVLVLGSTAMFFPSTMNPNTSLKGEFAKEGYSVEAKAYLKERLLVPGAKVKLNWSSEASYVEVNPCSKALSWGSPGVPLFVLGMLEVLLGLAASAAFPVVSRMPESIPREERHFRWRRFLLLAVPLCR